MREAWNLARQFNKRENSQLEISFGAKPGHVASHQHSAQDKLLRDGHAEECDRNYAGEDNRYARRKAFHLKDRKGMSGDVIATN